MDGALTPVNSPAVTMARRQHPAADVPPSSSALQALLQSEDASQYWAPSKQQPILAHSPQPPAHKSRQEMDSLLAAEKVCTSTSDLTQLILQPATVDA